MSEYRHLGRTQVTILRTVSDGRWFRAEGGRYRACLRLNFLGLLSRDPDDAYRFTASEKGRAAIIAHDEALARRAA